MQLGIYSNGSNRSVSQNVFNYRSYVQVVDYVISKLERRGSTVLSKRIYTEDVRIFFRRESGK